MLQIALSTAVPRRGPSPIDRHTANLLNQLLRPGIPRKTRSGVEYEIGARPRSAGSNRQEDW